MEAVKEYRTHMATKINLPENDMELDEIEEVTENNTETFAPRQSNRGDDGNSK